MNIKQKLHELRTNCRSFVEYQKKSRALLDEHEERVSSSWLENEFEHFLTSKTCVHQIHRKVFSDDELKKAFLYYRNSISETKCKDDHSCRLGIYKDNSCYLHHLLKKKAEDQIKNKVGN